MLKITYDCEADALYIQFRNAEWGGNVEIEQPGVVADLDDDGHLIGLEILSARRRIGESVLGGSVPIEQLALGKAAPAAPVAVGARSK